MLISKSQYYSYKISKLSSFLLSNTAQKMKFSIKDFFSKCDQIRSFLETAHLVIFTEEILNEKLHFLCSEITKKAAVMIYSLIYSIIASYFEFFIGNIFVIYQYILIQLRLDYCQIFNKVQHFQVLRLLWGGAYSDLSVNGTAHITERCLFEARLLSEETR